MDIKMKKIFIIIAGALLMLSSCQKPHYIPPTADRQGITSLSAIFTFGPFVDSEVARLQITDPEAERYVIPIPFYYPEASFDETDVYMTKVRVTAELQPNCSIEPGLGEALLDLTKENWFTYTNAYGESRPICITGERVKSNKCELISFALDNPALTGVIDKAAKTVTIITVEDLVSCTAKAQISAHATISPDPAEARSYDEPVKFTVTAHNGVDKTEYIVAKGLPEKIEKGFDLNTVEQLFNFDPVAMIGMPAWSTEIYPSLAYIDGKLVVCTGDGSAPIYLNAKTGVKEGTVTLGSAAAAAVTNDEGNYILYCNHANGGETFNIWKSTSVDTAPELFHSFTNPTSLPMGWKMKVNGSLDGDALIVIPNAGVAGVTSSGNATVVEVKNGTVVGEHVVDLSGSTLWGVQGRMGGVVSASDNMNDGWFTSQYSESYLRYIKSDGTQVVAIPSDMSGWGLNPNCLDAKSFNNVDYLALFVVSFFPCWGMGPELYLYDVTDKAQVTGGDVTQVPGTVLSNRAISWYQQGSYDASNNCAVGDVVIAPTADGFTFQLYYYDHHSQVIGGYSADCIKR